MLEGARRVAAGGISAGQALVGACLLVFVADLASKAERSRVLGTGLSGLA